MKERVIVYPSCDSEIIVNRFFLRKLREEIERTIGLLCISVSTKANLNDRMLKEIHEIDQILRHYKRGLFKVSVSISTKSLISTLEPRTSLYSERLETLLRLKEWGIASSVNLKPILPFIELHEYLEIVDDCLPFCNLFLLGGLYIDSNEKFGRRMLSQYPALINERRVEWLEEQPLWLHLLDTNTCTHIGKYISSNFAVPFYSDVEVVDYIDTRVGQDAREVSSLQAPN